MSANFVLTFCSMRIRISDSDKCIINQQKVQKIKECGYLWQRLEV